MDRDSTRRPTESTNLDPWGLPETELPIKEHTWAGSRSPAHGDSTETSVWWGHLSTNNASLNLKSAENGQTIVNIN